MKHPDSQGWSSYLDSDLPAPETRRLEEHLEGCGACRSLVSELEEIRRGARELPDLLPPRDLWPGIARAIEAGRGAEAGVIPLHPSPSRRYPEGTGTFGLSYPRAAAAGVVLALCSGLIGAALSRASSPASLPPAAETPAWVRQVGSASPELESSAREVARLEELLARYRESLDPGTVRILEKGMGVIDQAIQESLAALELDPGNQFLRVHLRQSLQAKADYLRDATSLVAPRS